MRSSDKVGGGGAAPMYRHPLLKKISPFLLSVRDLPDSKAKRKVRFTPLAAALAAVLMVLDTGCTLAVRCQDALQCMRGDFVRSRKTGRTYNGLMKALARQQEVVLPLLKDDLRHRATAAMQKIPRIAGFRLMAVDGSKDDLPRTKSHEQAFGIADNGVCPQAFITAIIEVQTGLPWDWRIDKGRASECNHLVEMIPSLPDDMLLLADGCYTGYPVWSKLCEAGKDFLIRVGGNVHLLRDLCPQAKLERRGDIVYAWPRHHQTKITPLRLRLIRVGSKKDPVWLLTSVLDPTRLSKRAAGTIYRKRWGVELFYRTLKRTLGYAKLRSRSGTRGRLELEWALIAATIMAMLGIHALKKRRIDPGRLSPAGLVRVLRRALLQDRPGSRAGAELDRTLAGSIRDAYVRRRSKRSRHRPVTRNTPFPLKLQSPNLRSATVQERLLAREKYPQLAA